MTEGYATAKRAMWLPKPIYEPLPGVYMAAGGILVGSAAMLDSLVLQTLIIVVGVIALVGGLVLALRRRAYRSSRSRERFDRVG